MDVILNQIVTTPLGPGRCQGRTIHPADTDARAYVIRLPINDATRPHLGRDYCFTHTAENSGLFAFRAADLK